MQTEDQLTTINTLSLFQTNKAGRLFFSENVLENVMNGTADPIKVLLQLNTMKDIINTLTNTTEKDNKNFALAVKFKEALLEAAQKQGKEFEYESAKFRIGEAGTKYDYSQCGDPEITYLLEQEKILKENIKARKDFLNAITKPTTVVIDPDSGEINTIYPPSKTSTTTLFCTLK